MSEPIDPGVRIGHVHLKVADLRRALDFYCGVLGFELTQRLGDAAAFVAAGGYHHQIGLNTWESRGGSASARAGDSTGLYHLAILYPTRAARSATPSAGWSPPGSPSKGPATTASARPSTSATPTRTGSSSTTTGPRSGLAPAPPTARSPCTRVPSTWPVSSPPADARAERR